MNGSNLLPECNFVFKLHCIYLFVKMLHILRGNSVTLVPRLSSAITPRLKNENYIIPPPERNQKTAKHNNKMHKGKMLLFKYKMVL